VITTFLDSNILIGSYKGDADVKPLAQKVLADSNRIFVASPFLSLEVLPFSQDAAEHEFMRAYFEDQVLAFRGDLQQIVDVAHEEAERHRIKAMDALHVAAAWLSGAGELITAELPNSPIYRTKLVKVVRLGDLNL
jgi:predicted nucleic acid-binding protein